MKCLSSKLLFQYNLFKSILMIKHLLEIYKCEELLYTIVNYPIVPLAF